MSCSRATNILLVGDDDHGCNILAIVLNRGGYCVSKASHDCAALGEIRDCILHIIHANILVNEEFRAAILHEAASHDATTCMPVEKSGQEKVEFEYREGFEQQIEDFNPTFAKVFLRYNPGTR